jgi:uncharacterized protein YcbK (DUF882 family)
MEPTAAVASGEVRALKIYHLHTHERATIVFKRNGVYDQAGLKKLNYILRDWRKNRTIKMDPHLLDLVWEAYRESGATGYIDVICGYRSPATNSMLRKRSRGVAKNSLHMQGKAMDFFIEGVPLAKLRAIGLRMQLGGVGFYPTSGSPFVHMDTGSVRHWPRMTRQQLVRVFPHGHTLHVPSDGKPLPGYAEALASYKARKASGTPVGTYYQDNVAVASNDQEQADDIADATSAPTVLAQASPAPATPTKNVGVAVAAYATAPTPTPRLAPRLTAPVVLASAASAPIRQPAPTVIASLTPRTGSLAPDFDFGPPQDWSAPAVPAALAKAMAARDQVRRTASLPIPPTSVVATIDVSRSLRAEAITTAVLRKSTDPEPPLVRVLAYADPTPIMPEPAQQPVMRASIDGIPMPTLSPGHSKPVAGRLRMSVKSFKLDVPHLTLTAIDTAGLKMWMSPHSTRQKAFALLTMPDPGQLAALMEKPQVTYSTGFGEYAYADLRTDRFSGSLNQQPTLVDLTADARVASIR